MKKPRMTAGEKMVVQYLAETGETCPGFHDADKALIRRIDAALRRAFRDGMTAAPLDRGSPVDAFGAKLSARYGVKP